MRFTNPSGFLDASRVPSARLKHSKPRMKYVEYQVAAPVDALLFASTIDIAGNMTAFYMDGSGDIYRGYATSYQIQAIWDPAIDTFNWNWTFYTATSWEPFHGLDGISIACNNDHFFLLENGFLSWFDVNTPTFIGMDVVGPGGSANSVTAVDGATQSSVVVAIVHNEAAQYVELLYGTFATGSSWSAWYKWEGAIPNVTHKPRVMAAQNTNADPFVHVYVDDHTGLRPLQLLFGEGSNSISATSEIVPLDATDDESGLKIYNATAMFDKIVLTGTLKRKYGGTHSVMLIGPDKFMFGRDLITIPDQDLDLKFLHYVPHDRIFLVSPNRFFEVPDQSSRACILREGSESWGGYTWVHDPHGFDASFSVNQPGQARFQLPWYFTYDYEDPDMSGMPEAGDYLDLEVRANSEAEWVQIGRFGVDSVRKVDSGSGPSMTVECTSLSMKRLADWESDAFYDYLAQATVSGDPADLTKLVRKSGIYDTDDGLVLETLNQDGVLYTTPAASHGGYMKAKFTNLPASEMIVGVGANYGEETLAEAAERLGVKIEEVSADERARYGVFAAYVPDWDLGDGTRGQRIVLFDYSTIREQTVEGSDTLVPRTIDYPFPRPCDAIPHYAASDLEHATPLYSWTLPFTVTGDLQLAILHQDSWVHVFAMNSVLDGISWTHIGSGMGFNYEGSADSDKANYGRGAIFMCKNTGMLMSYPFTTESDVIPLYTRQDRLAQFPPMMEDRPGLLPSTGLVLVDSEQIQYGGIAGYHTSGTGNANLLKGTGGDLDKHTDELEWLPGKVIARSVSNWGDFSTYPDVVFAKDPDKKDNYAVQDFTVSAEQYVTAVRMWVKKINFPEDGIEVLAFGGPSCMDSGGVPKYPLGEQQLGQGSLPAEKISVEGGMVTVFFNNHFKVVPGVKYRIVVRRARNPKHPNGINYYATKVLPQTSYTGGKLWIFQENNFDHPPFEDWMVDQNGDMPFQLFARVVAPGNEYAFPVKYATGKGLPSANPPDANYFKNMALTITQGGGQYGCYRIVRDSRLVDSMNNLFIFYLDRDPGLIFDVDTRAKAVPALYGLKRSQNDTLLAAHGDKAKVSRFVSVPGKCIYFDYATANEDLTVAEVAEEIARKAGVPKTRIRNRFPNPTWNTNELVAVPSPSQNMVFVVGADLSASSWLLIRFVDQDASETRISIEIAPTGTDGFSIDLYGPNSSGPLTLLDSCYAPVRPRARIRVSLYNGHLGLWFDGRLVYAYTFDETGMASWGHWTHLHLQQTDPVTRQLESVPLIPEAGTRVDSFVMDMGKKGSGLLQTLIGEKRIFYRDTPDGELEIYTERDHITNLYQLATAIERIWTDRNLATRILLEGGEVVEVSDAGNVQDHGNLFRSVSLNEINSLEDARYFAQNILEDIELNKTPVSFSGAADPRLEAGDVFDLERVGSVVIDNVSMTLMVDEAEAVFDMNASGRVKPVEMEEEE